MTEEDYCSKCGYFPPHCECKDYISIRDMKAKKSHIVRHQTKQIKQLKQQLAEKEQENQQLRQALERSNYLLRGYKAQMHSFKLSEVIDEHIVTNEQLLKGGE